MNRGAHRVDPLDQRALPHLVRRLGGDDLRLELDLDDGDGLLHARHLRRFAEAHAARLEAKDAVVFLLMGMRLANHGFGEHVAVAAAAIAAALLGRAATVYGCCAFFRRPDTAVPLAEQHILFWGGLRGALGVALALGLPETTPHRSAIEFLVFAVAGFSILVQGLTITPLLRRLGLVGRDHAAAAHP